MINPRRRTRHALWKLNGYYGRTLSLNAPQKLTALLTPYSPARMINIESQVRNILKCEFVDKLIVSNHNPEIRIEGKINFSHERLTCINQNVRRASGYRWRVFANTLQADYLVVIDDDILLFPSQLKILFQNLISEPEIPHGFSGMLHLENDTFEYRERENMEVDYLCEVYAVTRQQVQRYSEMEQLISEHNKSLSEVIERFGDFVVISQTGERNPKIHKIPRLLRSETFKSPGIATHKEGQFESSVVRVCHAVKQIKMQGLVMDEKFN